MLRFLSLVVVGALSFSCNQETRLRASKTENDTLHLELMWETTGFKTPESVLYDSARQVLYVSNINQGPWEKDENGFLSKVSLDGQIMLASWVTGLSAPKGMGLMGDTLFVTDNDELVLVDTRDGKVLSKYPASGSAFLNDLAVSGRQVFITDSRSQRLFRFTPGGKLDIWLEVDTLKGLNGIFAEGGNVFVGTPRGVLRIDTTTRNFKLMVASDAGIDGLAPWQNGYLVSDWKGETRYLRSGSQPVTLLNTTTDTIQSADFSFIAREQMLVIPTFFDDRVRAFSLKGRPMKQK